MTVAMGEMHARLAREQKTLRAMIRMYCRDIHGKGTDLCTPCRELQHYAEQRLSKCPFREEKPTCADCTVHCYRPEMRQRARDVMRHAGPRMIWRHPVLALFHLLDSGRKPKPREASNGRASNKP